MVKHIWERKLKLAKHHLEISNRYFAQAVQSLINEGAPKIIVRDTKHFADEISDILKNVKKCIDV